VRFRDFANFAKPASKGLDVYCAGKKKRPRLQKRKRQENTESAVFSASETGAGRLRVEIYAEARRKRDYWQESLTGATGCTLTRGHLLPVSRDNLGSRPSDGYAAIDVTAPVSLRNANDSITRASPLMSKLTPTSVPIAHSELEGHCM
jgi:hypothetical protein